MQKANTGIKSRKLVVLYDGYCPICRKSARIISYLDLLGTMELKKYQDFKIEELPVPLEKLGKRVHACNETGMKCSEGIFAFASIMIRIPPLFLPAVLCFILGYAGIGQKIYDYISEIRYSLPLAGLSRIFPLELGSENTTGENGLR